MTTLAVAPAEVLTAPQLLALADKCLAANPTHAGIDRYFLAAMAIQESGDKGKLTANPKARGDRNRDGVYCAWGLMQFHSAAWQDCFPESWRSRSRDNPEDSMLAAIRYANQGLRVHANKNQKDWTRYADCYARLLAATHHNQGHTLEVETKYSRDIDAIRTRLVREYGAKP